LIDTVSQLRRRAPHANGYIFAACWVGVYVVLFSLAKTKLPSYITPCYPGAALLMGAFVSRLVRREIEVSAAWLKLATAVTAIVGLVLLCVLPVVANKFLPGEEWLAGVGLIPLVAGMLGWMWVEHRDYARLAKAYAFSAVALSTFMLAIVPQRVDLHQQNDKLLAAIYRRSPQPQIGHYRHLEPTWVFYGGRPLANVTSQSDTATLTPEKVQIDGRNWAQQPKHLLRDFLSHDNDHFVITTRRAWEEARAEAPPDVEVIASAPYFLKKDELIVVARRRPATITTAEHEVPASLQRLR
jgi:4-amino-4-deoxy-L-arabinose transferase-like glycosyltransferase